MSAIRANRLLPGVVAAFALLFAVLEPQPSRGLGFPAALAFWLLHIGIGMLLAVWATGRLSRAPAVAAWNPWLRLLAGGVAGSLLFAPVALAIDALLVMPVAPEPADDLLDHWEAAGGARALLAEWLQLSPSYLASWLLLNAVPLAAGPSLEQAGTTEWMGAGPRSAADTAKALATHGEADREAGVAGSGGADQSDPQPAAAVPHAAATAAGAASRTAFLAQLPPAIGTDLIAIQVDLHYLQVRTARGRATVLGSIAAAEIALGPMGLRVHRSHWVSLGHVVRLARTARGTFLTLSVGSRVPVSRRRVGAVQSLLGRDFTVDPA